MKPRTLAAGVAFALAAGAMWGLVFVAPLLLPEYPAALQSFGRYLAFGLIALPLAWLDRRRLADLSKSDWRHAAELALIGNVVYYLFLASAIRHAGAPLPTVIIGTLPVVIAVVSNLRDARDPARRHAPIGWRRLLPSLLAIAAGIALVNHAETAQLGADRSAESAASSGLGARALGALLAVGAVACWTWYPIRNADWLRAHPDRPPSTWATAQGLATLPLAVGGYAVWWLWALVDRDTSMLVTVGGVAVPLGPRPAVFVGLMLALGLLASWLGTLCWNEASQRLPTTIAGQLIVFETLAALAYAYVLRGRAPDGATLMGVGLLIAGVVWAVSARPKAAVEVPPH